MLQLLTLGRLSLADGQDAILAGRRKTLALLAYLARREGQRVRRSFLADLLWPGVDETRARQSLRTALTELRSAVGDVLETDVEDATVRAGAIAVDVAQMTTDIARNDFVAATERWQGEFLAGLDDVGSEPWALWLDAERVSAGKQLDWAFDRLLSACESSGQWSDVVSHAERWVSARPSNERAAMRLVVGLRSVGRTADAAARFAALTRILTDANGASPSRAFTDLASTLRAETVPRPGIRGLVTPGLVGREDNVAQLTAAWAWARTQEGVGACAFVDGDEGLGKTRLVEDFGRTLRATRDAYVLQGRVFDAERNRPLSALRPMVDQLVDAPGLAGVPASTLAALGTVSARMRERFPAATGVAAEPFADAFVRALTDIAYEVPVAMLIDDAPAADASSLEVLEAIVRRPPPNLLIVLSGRPDALERWKAVTEVRQAGHVSWSALAPLTLAQTRRFLEDVGPMDPSIVPALSERLHRDTGGRPASIDLLIRELAERGSLALDAAGRWTLTTDTDSLTIPVPDAVSGVIRSRLTGMSPDARRVVECASVVGPRIDPAVLEPLSALTAEEFRTATADLLSRRLLRNSAGGDSRFEFSGEAERRAVYEQIVPSARREMHRSAARVLRAMATDDSHRRAAREHERLAGGRGVRGSLILAAAGVATVVGIAAMQRLTAASAGLPEGTSVLLASVQNLTTDSSLGTTLDVAARVGLQRSKQVRLFSAQQVRESIARMRKSVTPTGVDERLAQEIAIRENLPAVIHLAIASVDSEFVITGRVVEPERGRDLYTTDVRAAGRAEILASLDAVLRGVRAALGESRLVIRREPPLPLLTTSSLDALRFYVLGNNAWAVGRLAQAKSSWAHALELDSAFAMASSSMGMFYYVQGDSGIDRVMGDRYYDRALAHASRLTERERVALDAAVASMRGTPDDAVEKNRLLAERFPERDTWFNFGSVLMRYRRSDEAIAALRKSIAFDSMFASAWINIATTYANAGQTDSALASYSRAAAAGSPILTTGGNVNQEWGGQLIRAGRIAAAESLFKQAATTGSAVDRSLAFRSLGWLAMFRGRYREATTHLENAVGLSVREQQTGLTPARNRWLLGSAYLELGDVARARAELRHAESALGNLETQPIYLFYLARLQLRAGNEASAQRLQQRIERTARSENANDRIVRALSRATTALHDGRADTAVAIARPVDPLFHTGLRDAILSDAYLRLGALDSALVAARRLESSWYFGFEAQRESDHAGLRVAKLALSTGDTAQARASLERQLALWKDADSEFWDLAETRRLLTRLAARR